jgi:BRCA1-associated protein
MPSYYYHLKFELYATPDPTAKSTNSNDYTVGSADEIWVPAPGSSIFDDLPSHPRTSSGSNNNNGRQAAAATTTSWPRGRDATDGPHDYADVTARQAAAFAGSATKIIDCGAQRGRAHDEVDDGGATGGGGGGGRRGRNIVRLSERRFREGASLSLSPPPKVSDGIGPATAVRDWRFGRVRIESFDLVEDGNGTISQSGVTMSKMAGSTVQAETAATPAASLGPNLGGVGLATKARYVPLETKNTEAGWGIVHLYREGDESDALRGLPDPQDGDDGNGNGVGSADEEGTILCIPAVPSYMSPIDFLGFVGEKWRGDVSHYRMVMTSRMSRYMVLMKFRDRKRAREWRKEFDGKPFDSVEVLFPILRLGGARGANYGSNRPKSATLHS